MHNVENADSLLLLKPVQESACYGTLTVARETSILAHRHPPEVLPALRGQERIQKNATPARTKGVSDMTQRACEELPALYRLTPEETETIETYNALALAWNTVNPPRWKDDTWHHYVSRIPGEHVLDLGCGTARDAAAFFLTEVWKEFRYTGIDRSSGMLAAACEQFQEAICQGRASFVQMDMCELAFETATFDAFFSTAALMHIPRERIDRAMSELARVLKPRAVGFIATPEGEYCGMYEGQRAADGGAGRTLVVCWRHEDLAALLERHGFALLYAGSYSSMLLYIVELKAVA